ncbi:MAG: type II toxin-antitoxin system VapC family toxin [Woeseia sp.]
MVIADTGFWLALANRKDRYHEAAKDALGSLDEPLTTTWPVLAETCHLLLQHLGNPAQQQLIKAYNNGAFDVFDLTRNHASRIHRYMKKYADLPMDLADASLIILAEHLGHGRILSTDQRDFRAYRWKQRKPFENLLLTS